VKSSYLEEASDIKKKGGRNQCQNSGPTAAIAAVSGVSGWKRVGELDGGGPKKLVCDNVENEERKVQIKPEKRAKETVRVDMVKKGRVACLCHGVDGDLLGPVGGGAFLRTCPFRPRTVPGNGRCVYRRPTL